MIAIRGDIKGIFFHIMIACSSGIYKYRKCSADMH